MANTDSRKLFYSISEVAERFDLKPSTIRYWEKQFKEISPQKNARGVRMFSQEDLKLIEMIHHLVKERGMKLSGARKKINDNPEDTMHNYQVVGRLKYVKKELLKIKEELISSENK